MFARAQEATNRALAHVAWQELDRPRPAAVEKVAITHTGRCAVLLAEPLPQEPGEARLVAVSMRVYRLSDGRAVFDADDWAQLYGEGSPAEEE